MGQKWEKKITLCFESPKIMFPVHLTWRQHKMSKFQKIKKVTTAFILKVYRNLYEAGFVGMKDIFLNCTQNFY